MTINANYWKVLVINKDEAGNVISRTRTQCSNLRERDAIEKWARHKFGVLYPKTTEVIITRRNGVQK